MWAEDKLAFDMAGTPQGAYHKLPFTEAGVDVRSVKLKSGHLQIDGERMGLQFDDKGHMKRIPFKKVRIDIAGAPGDFGKALDSIFAPNLAGLPMPSYWQRYARQYFSEKGVATPSAAEAKATVAKAAQTNGAAEPGESAPLHIGAGVKPPRVLSQVEPAFTDLARQQKLSGNVQLYLWVQEDGSPSHVQIARPVGLGLDESAVASVLQYKFAPATKDGKPVKVDIYIDVNFQIF